MSETKQYASGDLEGKTIGGWRIKSKLPPPNRIKHQTGGNFSVCYSVERDGVTAFMKVLDFEKIFKGNPLQLTTRMEAATRAFNYEKELSDYCKYRRVSKVVTYFDSGDVELQGYSFIGLVSYIVYEMAQGDVRRTLQLSEQIELSARIHVLVDKLKSLHDVAVGLNQLHSNNISHQDIKPSNILAFEEESKIGDLGRSLLFSNDIKCPYTFQFNGDRTYAAPECFFADYNVSQSSLYQIDNYMLGSLICYYITGMTFNAMMNAHLPEVLRLDNCGNQKPDAFAAILPDLENAYQQALVDVRDCFPIRDARIIEDFTHIIAYLCHPNPERRGHPAVVDSRSRIPHYDLQRTIQSLDLLRRRVDHRLFKEKK